MYEKGTGPGNPGPVWKLRSQRTKTNGLELPQMFDLFMLLIEIKHLIQDTRRAYI